MYTLLVTNIIVFPLQDPRFNKAVDKKTGYTTKSILCFPILNYEEDVVGVAQIMNKTDGSNEFTQADEEVIQCFP